jgi:uncharacterized protein (DUF2126 family)
MSGGWCAGARGCTTSSCCRTTCEQDFRDALEELRGLGFAARPRLVRAAFRVPLPQDRRASRCATWSSNCATRSSPGMCWARKARAGGTARYVDSSRARAAARDRNWVEERYTLACNGVAVPLRRRTRGRIRGRHPLQGLEPALGLHPTMKAQAPLTFDVFDRWTGRSLGGLTTTSRIRAGAATRPSRSTPTRPRRAAARASSPSATRRPMPAARCRWRQRTAPSASTCGGMRA